LLFIAGLWRFNFTEKNNASVSPDGGLVFARHGTAYTAASPDKLHHLHHFAIYIDLVTSSDGLNSFEKIFSYFINQEEMNFILGQWKDGLGLTFRTEKVPTGLMAGMGNALKEGVRTWFLVNYDGKNILLYQDGRVGNERATGPKPFSNWDRTYPLVVGTDAGGRSQWKGTIHEIAFFDRALTTSEIALVSDAAKGDRWQVAGGRCREAAGIENGLLASGFGNTESHKPQATSRKPQGDVAERHKKPQAASHKPQGENGEIAAQPSAARNDREGKENPPQSPFFKGGETDLRPLIHYVFRPENTYETEFRGRKAIGIRDLGKGQAADLVVPGRFEPYQRVYLGWDPDWLKRSSDWMDLTINILGFVPLGLLLFVQFVKGRVSGNRWQVTGGRKEGEHGEIAAQPSAARNDGPLRGGLPDSGFGKENPSVSPFFKGGGQMTNREAILAVALAVVVGFAVSLAIEWVQAYLPSRDSSLRDLFANTLGTAIGAATAAWYSRKGFGLQASGIG
jgi:hypothetical protein